MNFSQTDIDTLKYVLTELSDEELYEHFGDVFEVIKAKLKYFKIKLQRKQMANYSNKSYQHELQP